MSERNLLINGHFDGLAGWTVQGDVVFAAHEGERFLGCAALGPGGVLQQAFGTRSRRRHHLRLAYKGDGAALTVTLTDGAGRTVKTTALAGAADWGEMLWELYLPLWQYALTVSNTGGVMAYVDEAWVWPVVRSRAEIAAAVADALGGLATDAGLSLTAHDTMTEGDYTGAVDEALRAVRAVDEETGLPDVRWLAPDQVDAVERAALQRMLERLQRRYATMVDVAVGPRRESLSQIAAAVGRMLADMATAGEAAGRTVQMRRMTYATPDWEWRDDG